MSVLDVKLRRELRHSAGLLLAIGSIIAVGVAYLVTTRSAYQNLSDAKRVYYAQCRMADFWIDLKKVPLADLTSLGEIPGVSEFRPRIQFFATADVPRVLEPVNGLVLSLPDRPRAVINDIVLRRGSYFTDNRDNEVIVSEAFARVHNLHPGSWIHLLLNNRRQDLFVVGTAISSEFVYMLGPGTFIPDPEHFGVFYLKQSYAEEVFDFDGAANQVVGVLTPEARARPRETLRRLELALAPYGVFNTVSLKDQSSNMYLSNEIQGLGTFGSVMPLIFLTVAALVLNVLMTRLTEQQRIVLGTFKALGYSSATIMLHFLRFGLVVGLIGGLIGCGLGYWFASFVTGMYRQFYEFPELPNRIYPWTYFGAVAISLTFAMLGTLQGTRHVLRLQPAEAMRSKPPRQGGAILLERFTWFWNRLTFDWRMVLRSVVRNRVRTGVGLFAAAMGSSLLVCGFCLVAATFELVDIEFRQLLRSDVDLTFKEAQSIDALREARRLPGVDDAEPVFSVSCMFENGPRQRLGAVRGLTPGAQLTVPRDGEGRPLRVPEVGLTMSRKMAELLGLKPGDMVTVRPIQGLRIPRQVPVVQITDTFMGLNVYADINYLSHLVYEESATSGVQLKTQSNRAARAELFAALKQLPAVEAVNVRSDLIENLQNTVLKNLQVMISMLVLFAGVIFFGSILNASLINLAERQREVATLRVLGYGEWQIGGYFFRESLLVNLAGTLLGFPLGYAITFAMVLAYNNELLRIPMVFPPTAILWTMLLSIFFGSLAHVFVQRSINRLDCVEALQMKE
ncbi:MAG: ABC transporter permease [Pirellulales bacterium]|nr:ABC transporter permease [Pirellulales bacterium]